MSDKKPTKKAAKKPAAKKAPAKKADVEKDKAPTSLAIPGYGRRAAK